MIKKDLKEDGVNDETESKETTRKRRRIGSGGIVTPYDTESGTWTREKIGVRERTRRVG